MSLRRCAVFTAAGAIALYAATWIPAGSYYLFFQREILRHDPEGGTGALLWARPAEAAGVPAEASAAPESWGQILHRGVLLPLPPGDVRRVSVEGQTLVVEYQGGAALAVDWFPPGFLRGLFAAEHWRINGDPRDVEGLDDRSALDRAARATPAGFRWNMGESERALYAAALLTKMLLWEPPEAAGEAAVSGTCSLDRLEGGEGRAQGAIYTRPDGAARAIAATGQGVFAFGVRGAAPAAWRADLSRWCDVTEAPPPAADLWRAEVKKRFPEGHPLRVWADARAP